MTDPDVIQLDRFMRYKPVANGPAVIHVNAEQIATKPVPERLFGLFTEHLGKNVYGGAWAQILSNGGFELFDAPPANVPEHQRPNLLGNTTRRLEEAARVFHMPDLLRYRELGTAPYWAPTAPAHAQYQLVQGMNGLAQAISLEDATSAGVETPIYLPLHRVCTYHLQLHAQLYQTDSTAPPHAILAQVWHADRLLGESSINLSLPSLISGIPSRWCKLQTTLQVTGDVPTGAPLKFRLLVCGPGKLAIDLVKLFPTDALAGWDPDVVKLLREMKTAVLRFPGGNFSSGYHWQDGIGPVETRPEHANPAWPEWEPNHVGTDEWLTLCELIGAEPMICVNGGNGTVEEAAAWVHYCNDPPTTVWGQRRAANGHPAPYNIRLWEAGNELWGSFQINWAESEEYGRRFGALATAMRAADPTIQLIATGGSMPDVVRVGDRQNHHLLGAAYARPALEQHGEQVWAIAEHSVMIGSTKGLSPDETYMALMAHAHHVGALIEANRQALAQLNCQALMAQTEQMVAVGGPEQPSDRSLAAAITWAGFMNWFLRSEGFVPLFTRSAMINHGDLLEKVREVVYPLPGYHGQAMYARQPGRYPVETTVETPIMHADGKVFVAVDMPCIDTVALCNASKNLLTVIAVNRHPQAAIDTRIEFTGFSPANTAICQTLAGPGFASYNTWNAPHHVAPFEQPIAVTEDGCTLRLLPHSINMVVFSLQQNDPR